ncbi:sensor histidine kinase [Ferruginibacter albus]|uniref:sensor histidine kinase n=1 Tax=Ferruginibacter albus TaxID=2875540 RepID=UPI001CC471AE|nr:HAMP domain-containing sensor histidine kinase [Ferruginibacter albus]UAY51329.1 HAMP domain-containing histidine kinase [Ferruginibacter albus]
MQYENTFKRFFIRNSYILVAAAWLITISFIIDNYWSGNSSLNIVQKNLTNYINKSEIDFDALSGNRETINKIINKQYDENFLQGLIDKKYFLFVYKQEADNNRYKLFFWNTQVTEPPNTIIYDTSKSGFAQLVNGYYVWRKTNINDYLLIALTPVKWNYSIPNEYLENSFIIGKELSNEYDISLEPTHTAVRSVDGSTLFYLNQKRISAIEYNNSIAIVLRLLGWGLLLLFIHLTAIYLVQTNFLRGVLFLITAVTLFRILGYYFSIPLNFRQFELFDPTVYGYNAIFRSLGDLLINALLFLWVILFIRYYIQEKKIRIRVQRSEAKWTILIIGAILLILCTLLAGNLVRSMVSDSQISFDVVNFFTLNIYSVLGFVILGCVAIGYFFSSQIIIYLLRPLFLKNILLTLSLIAFAGLAVLTIRMSTHTVGFEMSLLAWLLLYVLLSVNRAFLLDTYHIISSRLIFWLFFFSMAITIVIIIENDKKETENRKSYAETLSLKADPSTERLMNSVLTDFSSGVLAPLFNKLKNDSASNRSLKDSLLNENVTGYLNKYDTRIYTFDDDERSLFNQDSTTYNTLSTILKSQGKTTGIPDLYYYDVSYDKFSYISKKEITDTTGSLLGYVFILTTPKKYKTDALYPELFLKGYNNSIENSPVYSYAVYNNLRLVNSHNDYPFSLQLSPSQIPKNDFENFRNKGYDELWYNAGGGRVVIIAKEDNFSIEAITLFSYLFCSFLVIAAVFWLLSFCARTRLRWKNIRVTWQLSIRSQVHGIIIFISLLSFVVIGVATILFFISRYHNNNQEKLSETIQVLSNEVKNSVSEMNLADSNSKMYESIYRQKLEQDITRISEVNSVDVNLYDIDGTLEVSSLPLPYSKGIVSTKMDPVSYYHLSKLKEIQFFKEETIGSLKYLSNYIPVIDKNGVVFAYLNIPYFTSQTKLRQEISNFLVAIINLNAFIFLIAGLVALVITNRITRSFSFISNKMKEINLGEVNEEIKWNRNDEIGGLVKEYNKMVAKLDERAAALAKSEREGAWREMARQVAHEIKNPLTPMKLSLQYLQRAIDGNSPDVKTLSSSVAKTLVEQIDHLSQIAGEFSLFANIGNPKNEVFDLNESLKQLTRLHSIEENLQLDWEPLSEPVMINADKTQINRLFTNLIQNGIQAVPAHRTPHIQVSEQLIDSKILVMVKDNGTGIDETLQANIFTPNFTTKTSGAGLGLAMCKGIVEHNRGRIWFETQKEKGTTFFVELPLAED